MVWTAIYKKDLKSKLILNTRIKSMEKQNNSLSINPIWLNVASSIYVLPGFINLDNHIFLKYKRAMPFLKWMLSAGHKKLAKDYQVAAQKAIILQHDCRKKLNYPDNSVDHILCSHFLEHVYLQETKAILSDFYRVLKPGGTLHIIVPDLGVFIKEYITRSQAGQADAADLFVEGTILSKSSRGTLRYRIMEFQGGFGLQHRWMYDHLSMTHHVKQAGFLIDNSLMVPSEFFRQNDDSVHVKAKK